VLAATDPDADLDTGLSVLLDRQVLRASGYEIAFRHALFRDAAYEEVLPGRRRRLHRALGDVLRRRPDLAAGGPGAQGGEVAHHYLAARDWVDALPAVIDAGLTAGRAYAFSEALHHLRTADQIWDRVPDGSRNAPMGRDALLAEAAQAADLIGESAVALELVDSALRHVDPADRRASALLHERRGTYFFNAGRADDARSAFTRLWTCCRSSLRRRSGPACSPASRCWRWRGPGSTPRRPRRRSDHPRPGSRRAPRGGPGPQLARRRDRVRR
jgi:hypothetical protein